VDAQLPFFHFQQLRVELIALLQQELPICGDIRHGAGNSIR
jgi:hypothetical protein